MSVGGSEKRARLLAWGGNAWHLVEFGIAVGAGIAAGSIALIGFGADSLIEASSGLVVVWLFTGAGSVRALSGDRSSRSRRVRASVTYIVVEATRTLIGGHPAASWVGIGLAAFTAPTMPLLARAKRRVGHQLNSAATVSEAEQNQICAYLSIALLVGLLANALLGWWWADPAAALVIAGVRRPGGLGAGRATAATAVEYDDGRERTEFEHDGRSHVGHGPCAQRGWAAEVVVRIRSASASLIRPRSECAIRSPRGVSSKGDEMPGLDRNAATKPHLTACAGQIRSRMEEAR